jgi:hypothetical protein
MSSVNNLTKEPTSTPPQAYRSPPPIPNSHPPNDPPTSNKDSPTSVLASMPPQAPARTNIKTSSVSSRNQLTDVDSGGGSNSRSQVLSGRGELGVAFGNSTTSPLNSASVSSSSGIGTNQHNAKDTSPVNQNHENATDAVKRLVYKTVMMGSIPSLNMNSNNGGNNQIGVNNAAQNESEPLETTNYKNTPVILYIRFRFYTSPD